MEVTIGRKVAEMCDLGHRAVAFASSVCLVGFSFACTDPPPDPSDLEPAPITAPPSGEGETKGRPPDAPQPPQVKQGLDRLAPTQELDESALEAEGQATAENDEPEAGAAAEPEESFDPEEELIGEWRVVEGSSARQFETTSFQFTRDRFTQNVTGQPPLRFSYEIEEVRGSTLVLSADIRPGGRASMIQADAGIGLELTFEGRDRARLAYIDGTTMVLER